jgi:hypothetical protein
MIENREEIFKEVKLKDVKTYIKEILVFLCADFYIISNSTTSFLQNINYTNH